VGKLWIVVSIELSKLPHKHTDVLFSGKFIATLAHALFASRAKALVSSFLVWWWETQQHNVDKEQADH
jgi:hypothetical protein